MPPLTRLTPYQRWGKRFLDLTFSFVALLLLSPLILSVGLMVRMSLGAPVIFKQQRPGKEGEPFTLYKFRSMSQESDAHGQPLPDDLRLRRLGKFLRSTSLDELPELWNICRGDMSLVGPRPLLMEYLQYYTPEQARRHEVRPGLTGLAQVSGRNSLPWPERFALDNKYVDNVTLGLDLRILLKTVKSVVTGENSSAPGHSTSPRFEG